MNNEEDLARALAGLAGSGAVEVFDCGEALPHLANFQFELRNEKDRLLLHLWSDEGNLVRRVVGLAEVRAGYLSLEVARFGKRQPGRLEIISRSRSPGEGSASRRKFQFQFRRILHQQFPDEKVESLTTARDLERSLSGCFVRGVMRSGSRTWAVIGVASAEPKEVQDRILTFGLLWLDWVRTHKARKAPAGLRVFLPQEATATTAHRIRALGAGARIELYEIDELQWRVARRDVDDAGNLDTWLTPLRDSESALEAAREAVQRITALAPEAIDVVVPPGTRDVAFRFRGLEFARWHNGNLEFGLPEARRLLTESNWSGLQRLVRRLERFRRPKPANANHSLYRAQPERWLESLILRDPARLDAHLNPEHLYSQVPAFSAGDRGMLDLLGVRRDGRLAVIEIKASEDIHLTLQAADYWLRVKLHHQRGEFAKYGYFRGVELQEALPVLYLVAPGFRFHSTTEKVQRYLSPEIEVVRIGLNEGWRSGLQVIFRQ